MAERVRLVPFDSGSAAHEERLYVQRVACGWGEDDVKAWKGQCEAGRKAIWWLVSPVFPQVAYVGLRV